MDFLILNGKVVAKPELNLTKFYSEKTFQLEQKIWFGFGGIPLLNENVDFLLEQIELLSLAVPPVLKDKRELFRITKRMLNKNKFYRSGLIKIDLFWKDSEVNSIITSQAFKQFEFPLQEEGILLNISNQKILSGNTFNRFPFYHSNQWEVTKRINSNLNFQNSIFLNEKDAVCECIRSNIFLVKEKTLFTPSIKSGCYADILRNLVLRVATDLGLKVEERINIEGKLLSETDEVFIAGEETGINWVLGIGNRRYIHQYVDVIHKEINEKLKEKAG